MSKTTFKQKISLLLFGFILTLVLLEIALRVGGVVFLYFQEQANRLSLGKEGEYRILCLGESTTALGGEDAYPRQLEKILNSKQSDIKFTVINKGIPSITTTHIVSRLDQYLDKYQPHMVVTMMGINDGEAPAGEAEKNKKPQNRLGDGLQVVKFARLLTEHLTHKKEELKDDSLARRLKIMESEVNRAPSFNGYKQLAGIYRATNKVKEEHGALLKAVEMNPRDAEIFGNLGVYYRRLGEYGKAAEAFEQMLKLSAGNRDLKITAFANLAEAYKLNQDYLEAERVYRESIGYLPQHPGAFGCLADMYLDLERYEDAQKLYEKQLSISPKGVLFYGKLAHLYRRNNRFEAAERLLRQGIKFNPEAIVLYAELGYLLLEQKKYQGAEEMFVKALELSGEQFQGVNIEIYHHLHKAYEAQGKHQQAKTLKREFLLKGGGYNSTTHANYQELKEILSERNLRLVAVQYAMRPIEPVKQMLDSSRDVIFVDNEKVFKDAVLKDGYDVYFSDRFAGDFGHCTAKGNNLLAQNIAQIILANLHRLTKRE